ncbi:MAG: 3-octaprenyl-4-hydroxybenzoate carboxy-lyase, partial [Planctomycetota bacterium]
MAERRFVLAITGGSGVSYGRRLLECLARTGAVVHLVVSEAGQKVINHELQIPLDLADGPGVIR